MLIGKCGSYILISKMVKVSNCLRRQSRAFKLLSASFVSKGMTSEEGNIKCQRGMQEGFFGAEPFSLKSFPPARLPYPYPKSS